METLLAGFSISNELLILSLLTLPVKAVALWKAARIDQKWWFRRHLYHQHLWHFGLYLYLFHRQKI